MAWLKLVCSNGFLMNKCKKGFCAVKYIQTVSYMKIRIKALKSRMLYYNYKIQNQLINKNVHIKLK